MIEKREQFGRNFIHIILAIWMIKEVLLNTTIEYVFGWKREELNEIMAYVVLALLILQIVLFQSYQLDELIIVGIVTAFIVYATIVSGHKTLMSTWIFIVASRHVDFDKFIKISYYIQLFAFIIIIYMFFSGYISDYTIHRGNVIRHSLGFSHPNQLGISVFLLLVCRCYYKRNKMTFFDISLILVAAALVYKIANSKTSFYSLIILAIVSAIYIFMFRLGINMTFFANIMIAIAIVSNLGSILLSIVDLSSFPTLKSFDVFMSYRFSLCNRTMKYYGIGLWGKDVKLTVSRPVVGGVYHFWLDNAYMALLLRYGIIVFLIFSVLYIATMLYLKRTEQYYLLGIMMIYAVYGIMENNYFSMSQNLFLIALSFPLFTHNDSKSMHGISSKVKIVW